MTEKKAGFDSKAFLKAKFTHRSEGISVPDLEPFFPDGVDPIWVVRGLTGQELGRASEAADKNRNVAAILEGLMGDSSKEKAEAVKELLGIGGSTPVDVAKRMEHLVTASIDPVCTLDLAVRLCEVFPIEFFTLTNKIVELTGRGQMPGKSQPSGKTTESGQVSPSVIPGGDSSTK